MGKVKSPAASKCILFRRGSFYDTIEEKNVYYNLSGGGFFLHYREKAQMRSELNEPCHKNKDASSSTLNCLKGTKNALCATNLVSFLPL